MIDKKPLRKYQIDLIAQARVALRSCFSLLIQASTGAGKTRIAADIFARAAEAGKSVFFITHRQEIGDQAAEAFADLGLKFGRIASGEIANITEKIQICSIQSLFNLLRLVQSDDLGQIRKNYFFRTLFDHEITDAIYHLKFPDMIIFDEAHHCKSSTWEQVRNYYAKSKCIGLTATPRRLDGRGLGDLFNKMICAPNMRWLIDNGFLSDYRLFAPYAPSLGGVKSVGGDYDKSQIGKIMDSSTITGDAIKHYRKLADGRPALIFCVSIQHSQHIRDQFRAAGYSAEHIDGKLDKKRRKQIIDDFKNGKIKILTNVDIVGEGFDVPAVEVCILLRPTQSLTIYLQQVGRALRKESGKKYAIILDHAGNSARHGLPDEERNWQLEFSQTKKKKDVEPKIPTKICDKCYGVHKPAPICPYCGFVYEGRQPEQQEGELIEVDKSAKRFFDLREQAEARSLEDLIKLGKARGYKDSWAYKIYDFRQQKQQKYEKN